jgi:ADP-ribose pyrophosphatase
MEQMKSSISSYLSCLPDRYRLLGCHQVGEIEISTDPEIVNSVIKNRKSKKNFQGNPENHLDDRFEDIGIVFEDEYLLIVRDPVVFRNGKVGSYIRIFERSALTGQAGVVILPIRDGLIYFNKIFRHSTRRWELELPRGYREDGDSPEETVRIELLQEVGLKIESIYDLGEIHSNTGLLAGSAQAYLVTLLPGEARSTPEDGESISDTLTLTLDEVNQKIVNGEIRDGFTLSALYLAQVRNLMRNI